MVDRRSLIDAPERRAVAATDFELRQAGDNLILSGYASIFDHPYDVMGGAPRGWTETVDRRAFDVTLANKPDVHLLINHEGMPLARTKSGTLRLGTDARGLLVTADLDRRDPDVQRLETKMQRGDMDEMSFAFRVKQDAWSEDDSQRRLTEVSLHKGDVSVVNFGANPATSAQLNMRSVVEFLAGVSPDEAAAELRAMGAEGFAGASRAARAAERLAEVRRLLPGREARSLSRAEARAVLDGDADLSERVDQGNINTPNAADLNAAARQYAASRGWAMPNGSYPVRPANMHGADDLAAALRAVGRGSGSHNAIRAHIMRRAKAIGMGDQIPSNWNADGSIG